MTNKTEHICILELLVGISIFIGSINLPTLYTQIWPAFITWHGSVHAGKLQNHLSIYNHILFHNGDFTAACLQCFLYRIHSLCLLLGSEGQNHAPYKSFSCYWNEQFTPLLKFKISQLSGIWVLQSKYIDGLITRKARSISWAAMEWYQGYMILVFKLLIVFLSIMPKEWSRGIWEYPYVLFHGDRKGQWQQRLSLDFLFHTEV